MNKPFFSVIIPTYNRANVIERSIESVLNQSFQDFELILVNDGSNDETQEILNKYSDHIIILSSGKPGEPQGVSRSRNIGIKESSAEWICFLDSDDQWLKDKLKNQYTFIHSNPEYRLVHCEEQWIRNGKKVNQSKKHEKSGGDMFLRSLELCLISPSCTCLKKSLLIEKNLFREDFAVCEDYDLWLKITSKESIGFIDKVLVNKYGGHDDQLSFKFKAMDYFRVKSIYWLINHGHLNQEQKKASLETLTRKCEILLKGYLKHKNLTHYNEVLNILHSVCSNC